jgi:hypothetical protein
LTPVRRRLAWSLVAVAIAVFLGAALATSLSDASEVDWDFEPGWLALSLAAFVLFQGMHAEIWRLIARSLGASLRPADAWAAWNVSLLARYVPSQVLMPLTRMKMVQHAGVPRRVTLTSMVYEGVLAIGVAIALSASFLLSLPELAGTPLRFALLAVPIGVTVLLHPRIFGPLSARALRKLMREPLGALLSFWKVLGFALLYAVSFAVAGGGVYAFARALHPVDGHLAVLVLTSYAVGYTGSVLGFFVPGSLAFREGALVAVLAPALPLGVAVAVAVGVRVAQTLIELAYAGGSLALRRSG